ncbi:MAG: hypothetical protein K5985_02310 [Lachnospiraceae bacterium]|nr:hypothetical protein [Lachnospiraceae bacterium]
MVIIILFTLVIIAVGNMVTMSSFSTSLSNNITMFTRYMSALSDDLKRYRTITWLMDYWKDNAADLVTEDGRMDDKGNIDDILKALSEKESADITPEEASSLSPEDQKRFPKPMIQTELYLERKGLKLYCPKSILKIRRI